ncbi:MAG: hypothetical protein GX564_00650 [Oligosphaeraceae bacterium]|nr:hypothetical protein [Oligosphaeraceae bacterium]
MQPFAEILNFDWCSLEAAFCQPELSLVRAELSTAGWRQELQCQQAARIGRLRCDQLLPNQPYNLKIFFPGQTLTLSFTTLPAPEGKCLCRYAAIADPHVSLSYENRKGRLFRESAMIVSNVVEQANAAAVDFTLLAGDITNAGQAGEYSCARKILSQLQAPLICAPGDHDISSTDPHLWQDFFPDATHKYCEVGDFAVLALDTHRYNLAESDRPWLKRLQAADRRKILVSHVHLLPQPALNCGSKNAEVQNFAAFAGDFSALGEVLLYAGHQNVPCQVRSGGLRQINLPQPSQYLCSWYLVEVYPNGTYHKNIPISSEILRQQSRLDAEAAVELYQEAQWASSYRQGKSPAESNFLIPDRK